MGCDMASDSAELRAIAEPNTVLRGLVGSSVHGLVLDGTDDRDEMGVCVEPRRYVLGFGKFEQWVYRSAAEREGDAGARSCAGDLDLNMYSLRKWARLALQGNPTVLLPSSSSSSATTRSTRCCDHTGRPSNGSEPARAAEGFVMDAYAAAWVGQEAQPATPAPPDTRHVARRVHGSESG